MGQQSYKYNRSFTVYNLNTLENEVPYIYKYKYMFASSTLNALHINLQQVCASCVTSALMIIIFFAHVFKVLVYQLFLCSESNIAVGIFYNTYI